jgi:hypothetical protein
MGVILVLAVFIYVEGFFFGMEVFLSPLVCGVGGEILGT